MPTLTACIEDPSQISEARRNARQLAAEMGFDEAAAEKAAIVVTEAGTNLLKHASAGLILMTPTEAGSIEVIALDKGPGIADYEMCLDDGYSTTGTSGTGLGAIARLSSFCDIYSRPGRGTALLARVSPNGAKQRTSLTSGVQVPKPGQDVCGDHWGVSGSNGHSTYLLADGLGHGPEAARASQTAVEMLYKHPDFPPAELMDAVHHALRSTRGAAVAIAEVDRERGIVRFSGLGNVSATVFSEGEPPRRMVSINGTAGMEARHIREFTYPWNQRGNQGPALFMHSDGVGTHWNLSDYPALIARDPAVIAGVLLRDHVRRTDDATILVAK